MATYTLKVNENSSFARKLIELIMIYSKDNKDIVLNKVLSHTAKKTVVETKSHKGETFQKANRMINDLLEFE